MILKGNFRVLEKFRLSITNERYMKIIKELYDYREMLSNLVKI